MALDVEDVITGLDPERRQGIEERAAELTAELRRPVYSEMRDPPGICRVSPTCLDPKQVQPDRSRLWARQSLVTLE